MAKAWLILMLTAFSDGGAHMEKIPMPSLEACRQAEQTFRSETQRPRFSWAVCVPGE